MTDVERLWSQMPAVVANLADRMQPELILTHEQAIGLFVKPEHRANIVTDLDLYGGGINKAEHFSFHAPTNDGGVHVSAHIACNAQNQGFARPAYLGEFIQQDTPDRKLLDDWVTQVCTAKQEHRAVTTMVHRLMNHREEPHLCRWMFGPISMLADMARDRVVREVGQERTRLTSYLEKLRCYKAPTHPPHLTPSDREEIRRCEGIVTKWLLLEPRQPRWGQTRLVIS